MGKITKRKDGRYVATMMVRGEREYIYGHTRKECAAKAEKRKAEIASGITQPPIRVAAYLDLWERGLQGKRKPKTLEWYRYNIRNHITPHVGTHWLADLTTDHVQAMLDTLAQRLQPRGVRGVRAVLRRALNVAIARRYISHNAAVHVELPQVLPSQVEPLTRTQAQALLDAVKGHRLELLYWLALVLGLRRGELIALLWEDIDLAAGVVRIAGTLQRVGGAITRVVPKNESSINTMPLPPSIVDKLKPVQQARGLVFTTKTGKPYDGDFILRNYRYIIRLANNALAPDDRIPDTVTFHTLRHTCASFLIAAGANPRMVMRHMRHSQIATTMNVYAHIFEDDHRNASTQLADLFT